ncbi:MAG: GNAT family N-acetyltransferase [Pseudonocardiales bacterium]
MSSRKRYGVAEWERVALKGWPPTETAALGEWTLRAASGFTPDANSVLAVGDPGMPQEQALRVAADWYGDRGLPVVVQTPVGNAVDVALTGLSWSVEGPFVARTASVDQALAIADRATRQQAEKVTLHESVPDEWLAVLASGSQDRYSSGRAMSPVGRQVLGNIGGEGQVRFAQVASDVVHAIARGVLVDGVLLLGPMEVAPLHRGRGLGLIVTLALLDWAAESSAEFAFLRVAKNYMASVKISDNLGFTTRYTFSNRRPPVLAS